MSLPFPTADALAVMARLRSEGHPWVTTTESLASGAIPTNPEAGQGTIGVVLNAFLYAGGDAAAGQRALAWNDAWSTDIPASRNDSREGLMFLTLSHDILTPLFTTEQAARSELRLRNWCQYCLGQLGTNGGTATSDGDEQVGHFFGCRLVDRLFGSDYATQLDAQFLAAIGKTCQQKLRDLMTAAAQGGCWDESSEYNQGTEQLVMWGAHLDGIENWPELATLGPALVRWHLMELTPDYADTAQWGDVEHPHELTPQYRHSLYAALVQFGYDPDGQVRAAMRDLEAKCPLWQYNYAVARSLLLGFDPAIQPPAITQQTGLLYAPFVGNVLYRTPQTLLIFRGGHPTGEDHSGGRSNCGTRLWRGSRWSLNSRLGYDAPPDCENTVLFSGLRGMYDRGVVSATDTGDGVRVVWQTNGPYYGPEHYDRPGSIIDQFTWTEELVESTGVLKFTDVGVGVTAPVLTENYYQSDKDTIAASLASYFSVWHCDSQPTEVSPGVWQWTDTTGVTQQLTATGHDPALVVVRPTNLANVTPGEQDGKWQILIGTNAPDFTVRYTVAPVDAPVPPPPPPIPPPPPPVETWEQVDPPVTDEVVTLLSPSLRERITTTVGYERKV